MKGLRVCAATAPGAAVLCGVAACNYIIGINDWHDVDGLDGQVMSLTDAHDTSRPTDAARDRAVGHDAARDVAPPDVLADHPKDVSHDSGACLSGGGTIALLGGMTTDGSPSLFAAYGAVSTNGGAWTMTPFSPRIGTGGIGSGVYGPPMALATFGSQAIGIIGGAQSQGDKIWSTVASAVTSPPWSSPALLLAGFFDGAAEEDGVPALATSSSIAHMVITGDAEVPQRMFHAVYEPGGWGTFADVVGGASTPDMTDSSPSVAIVGPTLYVAYAGTSKALEIDSLGESWAGGVPVPGTIVTSGPPTLVSLTAGESDAGEADMMAVYLSSSGDGSAVLNLAYTLHSPGSGGWSTPALATLGSITPLEAVSLAALPGGRVVMVFRGANNGGFSSLYDPSANPRWTVSTQIAPGSGALGSIPNVAVGSACGVDAIAALATSAGIELVPLQSGEWGTPVLVPGTSSTVDAKVTVF